MTINMLQTITNKYPKMMECEASHNKFAIHNQKSRFLK